VTSTCCLKTKRGAVAASVASTCCLKKQGVAVLTTYHYVDNL
jgi:hypothetical protein